MGAPAVRLVFVILVVLGFGFHFLATWPSQFPATRFAWGCWLAAALVWAFGAA